MIYAIILFYYSSLVDSVVKARLASVTSKTTTREGAIDLKLEVNSTLKNKYIMCPHDFLIQLYIFAQRYWETPP